MSRATRGRLDLALLGASGHASVVLDAIESLARENLLDFDVVDLYADGPVDTSRFEGRRARVAGDIEAVRGGDGRHWIAAAGYPEPRRTLVARVQRQRLTFTSVVHPSAVVGTLTAIEEGSVVLAGAVLSPRVHLGAHTHIGNCAAVGHDTVVGAFTSVMPGARVAGDCVLADGVLIGSGATVVEKISIGADARIGAGAVVLNDVAAGSTVVGCPASPLR